MLLRNIDRLGILCSLVQTLSFTKTAESLGFSQPAVSKHVQELERAVGRKLFEREGHRIGVTEAGALLVLRAKKVLDAIDDLEHGAADLRGEFQGVLRLGASTVWEYLLPDLMARFMDAHPGVMIELDIANTERVIQLLRSQRVHVAFLGVMPNHADLEPLVIGEDELFVVGAPGIFPDNQPIQPAALAAHRFLLREEDSATGQISLRYLANIGARPAGILHLGSHEAIKRAVRAGLGLGILSKFAVADELGNAQLAKVSVAAPACTRPLLGVRQKWRSFSPIQRAFLYQVASDLAGRGDTHGESAFDLPPL